MDTWNVEALHSKLIPHQHRRAFQVEVAFSASAIAQDGDEIHNKKRGRIVSSMSLAPPAVLFYLETQACFNTEYRVGTI